MGIFNQKFSSDQHGHTQKTIYLRGPPGPAGSGGLKKTSDGDYDIENKKLRNVASPQSDKDSSTKKYVDDEVSKTLKKDGSDKMNGPLNMDNRRIENVGNGRHNTSDALTHLQLEAFYFDLNTDSGMIEVQNPIDMKNEKITNLAEGTSNSDAITKHQLQTGLVSKADKTELSNYIKRDGSTSIIGDFNFGNYKIRSVGNGTQTNDLVNKGYIDVELFSKPNRNEAILRDGSFDMKADLNLSLHKIVNLGPPNGNNDATHKKYVDDKISGCLKLDGSNKMTGNLDMSQKKIINCSLPTSDNDVSTKKYVDSVVSGVSGFLKVDG